MSLWRRGPAKSLIRPHGPSRGGRIRARALDPRARPDRRPGFRRGGIISTSSGGGPYVKPPLRLHFGAARVRIFQCSKYLQCLSKHAIKNSDFDCTGCKHADHNGADLDAGDRRAYLILAAAVLFPRLYESLNYQKSAHQWRSRPPQLAQGGRSTAGAYQHMPGKR